MTTSNDNQDMRSAIEALRAELLAPAELPDAEVVMMAVEEIQWLRSGSVGSEE